eukprot:m.90144 g.90144  ORF g.90144 m.90144 type:complete len:60 (+) comp12301_c4_seq1:99-278(+)
MLDYQVLAVGRPPDSIRTRLNFDTPSREGNSANPFTGSEGVPVENSKSFLRRDVERLRT